MDKKNIIIMFRIIVNQFNSALCDIISKDGNILPYLNEFIERADDNQFLFNFLHDSVDDNERKYQLVRKVSAILMVLQPSEKEIIITEFLGKDRKKDWWIGLYTRSTYYRRREEAIRKFVELFDIAHDSTLQSI